jgi:hypothetical protein
MLRGHLAETGYKPQFSGHGTFPLRYGWLKKAYDAVANKNGEAENKSIFADKAAIAEFGVGKNMVEAMRHWAEAVDLIGPGPRSEKNSLKTTEFGDAIFSETGFDPYLENPSSLWLLHWKLCGGPTKTTWHWAFSHYPSSIFERESLLKSILKIVDEAEWKSVSPNTVKRDVECFVRTYVARPIKGKEAHEDALECPLVELGLIRPAGSKDRFRFVRGQKPTLKNGVFLFALVEFWRRFAISSHLSFENVMHEPGSPGRVFLLDEDDVAGRLAQLGDLTDGQIQWSETAGLRELIWDVRRPEINLMKFVAADFRGSERKAAA